MKRLLLFAPFLFIFSLGVPLYFGLQKDPQELPSVLIGKPVPNFQLPNLLEPRVTLSNKDIKIKKPYLLNVWATWCPACKIEHPLLNEISKAGFDIVGLNYKDDAIAAQQWLLNRGNPYEYNLYDAEGRLVIDLGVFGAPETFVVDAEGIIQYRHVGLVDRQVWEQQLKPRLEQLMKPSSLMDKVLAND